MFFRRHWVAGRDARGGAGLCWGLVCVGLVLAGCATSAPVKPRQDRAPRLDDAAVERLRLLPDPVVRVEPLAARGNGPVYTVWGKSYRVMSTAAGFKQRGTASWYGTKFHGRPTSSGEPFDIYQLTAAHRNLPIPSYVRVTNLDNGLQTVVRVNDRGPFHDERIIDLSYAAAVKLGFHTQGTARVAIEVLRPDSPRQGVLVQAGTFSDFSRADDLQQALQTLTGVPGMVVKTSDGLYRVQLGPLQRGPDVERVQALMIASDYGKPQLLPAPCERRC